MQETSKCTSMDVAKEDKLSVACRVMKGENIFFLFHGNTFVDDYGQEFTLSPQLFILLAIFSQNSFTIL